MKKGNAPLIILVASLLLIILNFIFTSEKMGIGFWMRILSSVLVALAMIFTIKARKMNKEN